MAGPNPVPEEMYKVDRLPNNVTVLTAAMPHMASVALGVWVGVGARYEPARLSGISHFIEHLLFKGTPHRSAKKISQDVEGIGGYLNAFTSEDLTCLFSKGRHDRWSELLEVLLDMFLHSLFDPAEMEKERTVIQEELAMYLDQPQHLVHDRLNEILWPNHPLGRSVTGSPETVEQITREQLLAYERAHYVSPATVITATGPIDHDEFVRAVRRFGPAFRKGRRPRFRPVDSNHAEPRFIIVHKAIEQAHIAVGIQTCSRHDPRRFALRLLNTILGENMSSRLFQVIREESGLAYSIQSSLSFFDEVGALTISAGLDADKVPKVLDLTCRELRRLREKAPDRAEFQRARDYVIGQIDLHLESTENRMMWLGEQWLGERKIMGPGEIKERLAKVEREEISGLAREFFRPSRWRLAVVSPLKNGFDWRKAVKL